MIRAIYLYIVCLIAVVTSLISAISLVSSVVDLVYPDPYSRYYDPPTYQYDYETNRQVELPPEVVAENTKMAEREAQRSEDSQRRNAIVGIVRSLVVLSFTAPLFWLHWSSASREPRPLAPRERKRADRE